VKKSDKEKEDIGFSLGLACATAGRSGDYECYSSTDADKGGATTTVS